MSWLQAAGGQYSRCNTCNQPCLMMRELLRHELLGYFAIRCLAKHPAMLFVGLEHL
jgi:hypothetical protein